MTAQEFAVVDVVRLQVQEGWPDLPNLILNPNGEDGAWGWYLLDHEVDSIGGPGLSDWCALSGIEVDDEWRLRFRLKQDLADDTEYGAAYWFTDIAPAPAGQQARAFVDVLEITDLPAAAAFILQFNDVDGLPLDNVEYPVTIVEGVEIGPVDVPEGTTRILLGYAAVGPAVDTHRLHFRDAWVVYGPAVDVAASDPLSEPPWVDILGSAASITVDRDELNVGVLEATLYDSTLDPASTDLIRPGKRVRLETLIDDVWESLFVGKLENPSSAYEVRDPNRSDLRRVKIQLVGSDAAADLAGDPRPEGVSTIDELPYVLLGTGVPFNVNGSDDAVAPSSVVVVAINDQATALDQVAVTRDSVLGFAWIDRAGVLQAWDRGSLPAGTVLELDESEYSDVNIDFDVDRTFNTIKVTLLRINPGTGETEEIPYGPYVDEAMRREWRTRTAEFKVQGVDEDLIDEYAAEILELNATPVKRVNSVTLPLRTVDELETFALIDLYDLVSLSNDIAGVVGQESRVTSLKHRILIKQDGGRGLVNRWWIDLDFSTEGNVASPQQTPSPTEGGARTVGQLLRPIGEVTMWFGAFADIPAGWLPLDGSAFDDEQYPALAVLLGGDVLPNMEDRFPIGAGTKALGTSGGSVESGAPIVPGVGWASDTGAHVSPKLSEYDAHTHSVLNPWRSLWFIIRAA